RSRSHSRRSPPARRPTRGRTPTSCSRRRPQRSSWPPKRSPSSKPSPKRSPSSTRPKSSRRSQRSSKSSKSSRRSRRSQKRSQSWTWSKRRWRPRRQQRSRCPTRVRPPARRHPMSDQPGRPRLVLGVTGGISAYKAIEVCRRLVDAGVHVVPVLTQDATRFVTPLTSRPLPAEPVQTSLFDAASPIPHTVLGQGADLVLVAPATAHFLARYAAGLADDLLSATLLATRAPVVVCPAMHTEMWEHASVRENLATLARRGVHIVPPEDGHLAGGDSGPGRLAEGAIIVAAALSILHAGDDLAGRRGLVSGRGTREPLDPVRFISNRSSGKQGHALAAAAAARGADVVLVTASALADPASVRV